MDSPTPRHEQKRPSYELDLRAITHTQKDYHSVDGLVWNWMTGGWWEDLIAFFKQSWYNLVRGNGSWDPDDGNNAKYISAMSVSVTSIQSSIEI